VDRTVTLVIASPIESYLVEQIAALDARLDVVYRPDLIGRPRYPADHTPPVERTEAQAGEWAAILARAEVLFDIDGPSASDLPRRAPRLRWIQASSSGVGQWIRDLGLVDSPVVVTNAAGIHAEPLAEFVLLAVLHFAKHMPRMVAEQRAHRWERTAVEMVRGKTLGIIGMGRVGREMARLASGVGLRVVGARRTATSGAVEEFPYELRPLERLHDLLAESHYLVLIVPLTPETRGLIGAAEIQAMRPGAVLINLARGPVVDEQALVAALRSGHLAGAALDVFTEEPLPTDSPFWDMPNVLVTPHSMSTVPEENQRLVDLFCDNLRRYLAGEYLLNVVDKMRGY